MEIGVMEKRLYAEMFVFLKPCRQAKVTLS